jgi:hypothetical protein
VNTRVIGEAHIYSETSLPFKWIKAYRLMIPNANGILNKYQRFRDLANTDIDIKTGITKVGRKNRNKT